MSGQKAVTRRDFLGTSGKIAVACCFLPCVLEAAEGLASAAAGDLSVNIDASENAALKKVGGAIYLETGEKGQRIIVWRQAEGSFKAFSSACTHKGVKLNLPKDGEISCPAHGARFNSKGEAVKGPAKSSLKEYPCSLDGSTLKISFKA